MPSAPIVLERKILYKNPKNFSQIEKIVTIATVLKNPFNFSLLKVRYRVFYSHTKINIISV